MSTQRVFDCARNPNFEAQYEAQQQQLAAAAAMVVEVVQPPANFCDALVGPEIERLEALVYYRNPLTEDDRAFALRLIHEVVMHSTPRTPPLPRRMSSDEPSTGAQWQPPRMEGVTFTVGPVLREMLSSANTDAC